MMKPTIFVSHVAEEAEVAIEVKNLIEPAFLGLLDIFVSSDGDSLGMGQKWLDTVSEKLKNCAVQVVICSPKSVAKPWVNFEAGAAWVRDVPVIPLCHSGITPGQLPIPLSLLQGASLSDVAGMKLVINVLAQALGATVPRVDLTAFTQRIKGFEERYTFWDRCNQAFGIIAAISEGILDTLRSHAYLDMDLPEQSINAIEQVIPFLRSNDLLDFRRIGRSSVMASVESGQGAQVSGCELRKLHKLDATMASVQFKPFTDDAPGNLESLGIPLTLLIRPRRS